MMSFSPPFENILERFEGVLERDLNRSYDLVRVPKRRMEGAVDVIAKRIAL
jgi:hypothetical protein